MKIKWKEWKAYQKWKAFSEVNPKKGKLIAAGLLIAMMIIILLIVLLCIRSGKQTESTGEVRRSADKTGYVETGSIDVGTTTQSFALDISEYTSSDSFSFDSMGGGGMPGMDQMGGGSAASSLARTLTVEEVYVESGQEIAVGDPILKLTAESVESIRSELEEDVSSAKVVYEQAVTSNKQTKQQAEADLATNSLYASYSDFEYEQTIADLEDAVETAQETLETAQETLNENQEELSEKQELLTEEKQVLANATYSKEGTDENSELYWWIVAYETEKEAKEMVKTLEDEIEDLEDTIESGQEEVESAQRALSLAQESLEKGRITATETRDKRDYQAEYAQEIYDVAVGQGDFTEQQALDDYEEAQEKLSEFDEVIVNQVVYSTGSGLITDVLIAAGDTLQQNTELLSMNDYEEVTISLSVSEDDLVYTQLGSKAQITVAAFPDQTFEGEVTEIGDAQIDNSTNKTMYSVTVTVKNPGNLLYQDMTAEVTFQVTAAEGEENS